MRAARGSADRIALALIVSLFSLLSPLFSSSASAVEPDEILKDPVLEARARAVTQELRCVVCQNQSVDDSDAPLAADIRKLVRERIIRGDSDAQVRDYIVARYGTFVLLRPPVQGDTLILWFGPVVLLIVGLGLAWLYVRRSAGAPSLQPLSPEEEDAVRRLVEDEARRQ